MAQGFLDPYPFRRRIWTGYPSDSLGIVELHHESESEGRDSGDKLLDRAELVSAAGAGEPGDLHGFRRGGP